MLQVQGLNVYYGESHILRGVDLNVPPGQMVCLIGRNGVGKTTLLKTIMGLIQPRSGAIALAGEPITKKSPDRRAKLGIGYVPQGREIIPRLTVEENLLLGKEALPSGRKSNQKIPDLCTVSRIKIDAVAHGRRFKWGTTTTTGDRSCFDGTTETTRIRRTH